MSAGDDYEEVVMSAKEIDDFVNGNGDVKNEKGESLVLERSVVHEGDEARQVPEASSEELMVGEGVRKQILTAGKGECPKKHATCFGECTLHLLFD